jgi:hypothetical protein
MAKRAGGSRESHNTQTAIDQTTQNRMAQIWSAAQAAGSQGPSPLLGGAADYNTGLQNAGAQGVAALSGDRDAVARLMDPYQGQVIDAANVAFDRSNALAQNAVNSRAVQAGAFGGSRHGITAGVAMGENERARNSQIASLLSGGFESAMGRAQQLAQGGFAGAGANANLGMSGVGSPAQWYLQMLNQGFHGPMGQGSSGATAKVEGGFGLKFPFLS